MLVLNHYPLQVLCLGFPSGVITALNNPNPKPLCPDTSLLSQTQTAFGRGQSAGSPPPGATPTQPFRGFSSTGAQSGRTVYFGGDPSQDLNTPCHLRATTALPAASLGTHCRRPKGAHVLQAPSAARDPPLGHRSSGSAARRAPRDGQGLPPKVWLLSKWKVPSAAEKRI